MEKDVHELFEENKRVVPWSHILITELFLDKTKTLMIQANQTLEKGSHSLFTTTNFWVFTKKVLSKCSTL